MSKPNIELLVVDDEEPLRAVLADVLSSAGYIVTAAQDGEEAWKFLDAAQHQFSTILLDRRMPNLDGIGLLARIKADKRFANIPVIFQSAINAPTDIVEGIKAGVYYYLIKPFDNDVLFAIVKSAVNLFQYSAGLGGRVSQDQINASHILQRSQFQFRTLEEARALATSISNYYPQPDRVALGISELLINAVEHGNLGISYEEKSSLLREGIWEEEVERRLKLPGNLNKKTEVQIEHSLHEIRLSVSDGGAGFDSLKYMDMSPERAFDPNGRGIAMSKLMSFDSLEYKGCGNHLVAVVKI